jgi:hypothetical protein
MVSLEELVKWLMLSSGNSWLLKPGVPSKPTISREGLSVEANKNLALGSPKTQPDSPPKIHFSKQLLKMNLFCRVSASWTKQARSKAPKPTESLPSKLQISIYSRQSNPSNLTQSLVVMKTSTKPPRPLMPATWSKSSATRKSKIVLDAIPMVSTHSTKMLVS